MAREKAPLPNAGPADDKKRAIDTAMAQIERMYGIGGVQGVLCVHKGHLAAPLLGLRDDVQSQGGLAGGFRPVDLDDPAPGHAANAQRQVQGKGACGDGLHV